MSPSPSDRHAARLAEVPQPSSHTVPHVENGPGRTSSRPVPGVLTAARRYSHCASASDGMELHDTPISLLCEHPRVSFAYSQNGRKVSSEEHATFVITIGAALLMGGIAVLDVRTEK